MQRKGFPESYDVRRLIQFLSDIKAGIGRVEAPMYSHLLYDIVPGEVQVVSDPDIVLVEGLNVLQTSSGRGEHAPRQFVSDFFDFSIYVDVDEADLEQWYVARFSVFRDSVFQSEHSYFHRYASLSNEEVVRTATEIWRAINLPNLHDNIVITRERAHLILEKGADHAVRKIRLRKL